MPNLNQLHKDHLKWLKELDFFQDEIKFFQNKLFSVVLENDHSLSIEEHIEEYRELFFLNFRRIDDLRFKILSHEKSIRVQGREFESMEQVNEHDEVAQQVANLESALMDLRKRFKSFASHHLG